MNRRTMLFLLACTAASGCSPAGPTDRATVSGSVVFEGKPVTGGSIRFVMVDDFAKQAQGRIRKDGTFTLTGCPVGTVKVAVETTSVLEGVPGSDQGEFVRLPPKFVRPETTPVNLTVPVDGVTGITIDLK